MNVNDFGDSGPPATSAALEISVGFLLGAVLFLFVGAVSAQAARRMRIQATASPDQVRAVSRNAVFLLVVGVTALVIGIWVLVGVALRT